MQSEILIEHAQFAIGQPVRHQLLEYRGIVVDVDPRFRFSTEWFGATMKGEHSSEQPWYHVLVHNTNQLTYVPEEQLLLDASAEEFEHPVLELLFTRDAAGHYQRRTNLQ